MKNKIKKIICRHEWFGNEYVASFTAKETSINIQQYKLKSVVCRKCGKVVLIPK